MASSTSEWAIPQNWIMRLHWSSGWKLTKLWLGMIIIVALYIFKTPAKQVIFQDTWRSDCDCLWFATLTSIKIKQTPTIDAIATVFDLFADTFDQTFATVVTTTNCIGLPSTQNIFFSQNTNIENVKHS